jgi:hypothetical protein
MVEFEEFLVKFSFGKKFFCLREYSFGLFIATQQIEDVVPEVVNHPVHLLPKKILFFSS